MYKGDVRLINAALEAEVPSGVRNEVIAGAEDLILGHTKAYKAWIEGKPKATRRELHGYVLAVLKKVLKTNEANVAAVKKAIRRM